MVPRALRRASHLLVTQLAQHDLARYDFTKINSRLGIAANGESALMKTDFRNSAFSRLP